MITFKNFLLEGYKNLFSAEQKQKYAEEAFAQLQKAYEKIGGIQGKGFDNIQDFIDNIPFWKLRLGDDGRIIAAAYYKDRNGRKRVAVSSDGSPQGKKYVADIMVSDLTQGRAFVETSASSLQFLVKNLGYDALLNYAIDPKKVAAITGDELTPPPADDAEIRLHPKLKDFFYQRELGGKLHTKLAVGTPNKKLV